MHFTAYMEGPKFASTRDKLNDHRIKFFAEVIKDSWWTIGMDH